MDILLILIALGLLAMNAFWLSQARSWKRRAQASERAAMGLTRNAVAAQTDAANTALIHGLKVATGGMYLAALRADADDHILDALRVAGRRLLGEEIDEPVVQVLGQVSHEYAANRTF